MANVKMMSGQQLPLEMHKVRIVQKINLLPVENRLDCISKAGCNTFLLQNKDVFLDMLTDSGVNAMSDNQQSAMLIADDSYAGSMTFTRLVNKINEIFGTTYVLPAHQGRACENVIASAFVREGDVVPMNYHFTTPKTHIVRNGGTVEELLVDEGTDLTSMHPFKGNMDLAKLQESLERNKGHVPFIRMEAGTNLIGGQPFELENARAVCKMAREYGVMTVLDASLLQDNLYFMKVREKACEKLSVRDICYQLGQMFDIVYFSGRKLGFARGGAICTSNTALYDTMKNFLPVFEGFLTYGGMSVREMEAMTVGLEETMDMDVISQGPQFIQYMTDELVKAGVPVVLPAGGLGCHLDASKFVEHVPQSEYRAGALAVAMYIASGIRGMERGTISEERNADGTDHYAAVELLRLAVPRRVYTLSHINYAIDRVKWLYENRHLIGGLEFVEEPKVMRFFIGRLQPKGDWMEKLAAKFRHDFGDSL